jgi:hypothetical protein
MATWAPPPCACRARRPCIGSMTPLLGRTLISARHRARSLTLAWADPPPQTKTRRLDSLAGITERAGLKRTTMSTDSGSHPKSEPTTKIYRGQRYELVGTEPYTRLDGGRTTLAIWRSACPTCCEMFETRRPVRARRFGPNRRGQKHKRRAGALRMGIKALLSSLN